jgi:D-alanyl-D-alanine dipeptidase
MKITTTQPEILNQLIDVCALSQQHCSRPILANLVYATPENFIGRPIQGYEPGVTDFALLTKPAAIALCQVQNALLKEHDMGLLIWDSYRPKQAVRDFMAWSNQPVGDDAQGRYELERKAIHYPRIEKNQMFDLGYVAEDSQHCYGSTVDLVLIDKEGKLLDLGACFDFMDELSHYTATAKEIGEEAIRHRGILSGAMLAYGFKLYPNEFWHFDFKEKPITEPMDFAITRVLKGLNVAL